LDIDTRAILSGDKPDLQIATKDIVYVSVNPWKIGVRKFGTLQCEHIVQGFIVEGCHAQKWPNLMVGRLGPESHKPWIRSPPRIEAGYQCALII